MIYNDNFIWVHLGKTGGDSTRKLFNIVNKGDLKIIPEEDPNKHTSVYEILELTKARTVLLNVRPLDEWALSHVNHQKRYYGVDSDDVIKKGKIRFKTGVVMTPDEQLKKFYIDEFEGEKVDYLFIKTNDLVNTFIDNVSKVYDLTNEDIHNIKSLSINKNGEIGKRVKEVWTKDIIDTFYSVNPLWVKLVNEVYGSIKNN